MKHPLHPALVHFPIACWSLATATDVASLFWGATASQWSAGLLTVGSITALVAMTAGMLEMAKVPEGPALNTLWAHMGLMSTAFIFYLVSLLMRVEDMQALPPDLLHIILSCLGFVCLAIGGFLGGKLVYHHGIGQEQH